MPPTQQMYSNFTVADPDVSASRAQVMMAANITGVEKANAAREASARGDYDTAIRLHQEGLELKIAGYGERSVQAALSLNSLGETYLKANKITEAEEVLKKALLARDDVAFGGLGLGPRIDAAATTDNLGQLFEAKGQMEKAKDIRMKGLEKGEMMCGNFKCITPGGALLNHQTYKQCSSCRSVFYCSVACQKMDWKTRHKTPCKAYADASQAAPSPAATSS